MGINKIIKEISIMSTTARIGILQQDGKVKSIVVHQDGNPSYTGKMLCKYYTTEEEIHELMKYGDIRCLAKTAYDSDPLFATDEPEVFDSLPSFFHACREHEHMYIFSKSEGWKYRNMYE